MAAERRLAALALAAALLAGCGTPAPPLPPPQATLQAQQQAGARALVRGDLPTATAAYRRALAAAESVEDFDGIAVARLNLATVLLRQGRAAEAEAQVDALLAAPQRYPLPRLQQASARKALSALDAGRPAEALAWAERAEAGCAAPCELSPAMDNLRAAWALQRGDAALAATLASRAAVQARAHGPRTELANALRLHGRALTAAGDTAAAAALLAQALEEDRALGLPERIALDLLHAAENEQRRGDATAARAFYERALQVSRAAGLGPLAERALGALQALGAPVPR